MSLNATAKYPARKRSDPYEFWGFNIESGKKYSLIMEHRNRIRLAVLDPASVSNGEENVALVVERDGSEFVMCNLNKEIPQVELNLYFDKGEKVFSLRGQGAVLVTGYKVNSGQSVGHLQSNKNSSKSASTSVLQNTPQESDDSSEDEYTSSEDASDDGMETDENKAISELETSSEAPSSEKKKNKADDSTTANESNVSIQESTKRTNSSK